MDHVGDHTLDVPLTLSGKSQRGSAHSSAKRGVAAYTECGGIMFLHVFSRYFSVHTRKLLEMV
jgi:cobyrinic acid a,c-diamide synthase